VENVSGGTVVPVSERQARPLARLEPDQQKQAWQKAVETAPEGTAAHVQKVVREMVEPEKAVFRGAIIGVIPE